jgi:addiction module HigA family antidote
MINKENSEGYSPDIAIPPGETLKEVLESKSITQKELALRMNRPIKTISEIMNGKASITPETAYQLEQVLDIPASFWLKLEANYQISKERISFTKILQKQAALVKRFPYSEMSNLGWVKKTRDQIEKVSELLSFFGVTELKRVSILQQTAFRKSKKYNVSSEALCAWLRKGEIEASNLDTKEYKREVFKDSLNEIRDLTTESSQTGFEEAKELCRLSGIAFIFTPHLKKTHVNGAARWISPKKAVIQLSDRYKYEDIFWFTFFHEAGHILLHGKKDEFIDLETDKDKDKHEIEADNFAREMLIPSNAFDIFLERCDGQFLRRNIINFASEQNISPGIIVGRLQHEGLLPHNHMNSLRKKLDLN